MEQNYKSIKIESLYVSARSGAILSECHVDMIELCAKTGYDVVLTHNNKFYRVSYRSLLDCVVDKD